MDTKQIKQAIESGRTALGVEFGSTRIKAVLISDDHEPIAIGTHDWENRLDNGLWTYTLDDIHGGLQDCYLSLKQDVRRKYGVTLQKLGAVGVSAMMHGYLAFDKDGKLLVPFRTWRNTNTAQASDELTALLDFHIPQRWSIAHLYQAVLNKEPHVPQIAFITTLAGYAHRLLTGEKVIGVGDASGMFPIDSQTGDWDQAMLAKVSDKLSGFPWKLADLLPKVLSAGESAGTLTAEGAKLLDPSGELLAGAPLCPPEGDAGTGMTATNSVAAKTGNVSAGTSVFAMIVLDKALSKMYPQIDMVTTPTGKPVAMVHCNNCTSDLNAWVSLFGEFAQAMGMSVDANKLFGTLYAKALEGDADCGGLMAYNFFSGEHNIGLSEGRPLFARTPDAKLTLANFMRTHLYSSLAVLKTGMDLLLTEEKVEIKQILGHGGLFKTKGVGQRILAAAIDAPVTVMETAGEGGAWGIALLAAYMARKADGETLEGYLADKVFAGKLGETIAPDAADVAGYRAFMQRFTEGLPMEREAVRTMKE